MNVVKRFIRQRTDEGSPQDNALGLMHLRRLFLELCHAPRPITQREQEEKLYVMLPVFNKVFADAPPNTMAEKFVDLLQFATHVSRLMVTEIRRRASNRSTEAASCAIVQFLEIHQSEETSRGWMLLKTIKLLASSGQKTVDCMTTMSLPSTLVKCLYLFFDLPSTCGAGVEPLHVDAAAVERRAMLQKVFGQILVRLCRHVSPAEELAQKDDLQLLFTALTSWCPAHNLPWRKSAAEVLLTLSRHGLSFNVLKYLHDKECVAMCVQTLRQPSELQLAEHTDMLLNLLCFLKDSGDTAQSLLDDFRACHGYQYLTDFLLRLEQAEQVQSCRDGLRNLVLLIAALATCGQNEPKQPAATTTGVPYILPGFTVPQALGKGATVRNLHAYGALQSAFLRAHSSALCCAVLDVTSNLFHSDPANFFILEPQRALPQFSEKLHLKPREAHSRFFRLVEFPVESLNYVPCKELIGLGILLKAGRDPRLCLDTVRSLRRIVCHHPPTFRDVFRDVGLLEALVMCLHCYAALLKDPTQAPSTNPGDWPEEERQLAWQVMDMLTMLLQDSNTNAATFRELGGARCVHNIVRYPECRSRALSIIQRLVLSASGDDDLGTLLGFMHTAAPTELQLKTDILLSLVEVLSTNHRARTMFRKVGGFVYVTSLLVAMEGSLDSTPRGVWAKADSSLISGLLRATLHTLTTAMHDEPANARFFTREVQYDKLAEALRLLGCFGQSRQLLPVPATLAMDPENPDIATVSMQTSTPSPQMSGSGQCDDWFRVMDGSPDALWSGQLCRCAHLLHCLYLMATDNFEKWLEVLGPCRGLSQAWSTDAFIVHPGAVLAIIDLLPSISSEEQLEGTVGLQLAVADALQNLMQSDQNQQVMCQARLPGTMLWHCGVALSDESHPLHTPLQRLFERLAAQTIEPAVLRDFLRLGNPLNCLMVNSGLSCNYRLHRLHSGASEPVADHKHAEMLPSESLLIPISVIGSGSPLGRLGRNPLRPTERNGVPLTRVKCLVSMTTPRDVRLNGGGTTPPFVQFDMRHEGFGCLFLHSLAPQNSQPASTNVSAAADTSVASGLGSGERIFPPQSGLTFSTWFCVDRFPPPSQPHPVRLFTVARKSHGSDQQTVCLSLWLSSLDHTIMIVTAEHPLHSSGIGSLDEGCGYELLPTSARLCCPELSQEGHWHHLVVTLGKGVLKNSSATVYVNGQLIGSAKLHYVHASPSGSGSTNSPSSISVVAYVGTPPCQRAKAPLIWQLGPTFLFEEVVNATSVVAIFELGPHYVGSFQAILIPHKEQKGEQAVGSLVPEERVSFGLFALSESCLTVAKIRKIYNKTDSKAIAKQLGLQAHDNATPVRLIFNSACHLSGPARTIGAAVVGYLGVRSFVPRSVATALQYVGGAAAILGLVAMASDVEGLYAAVKALVCIVKSNELASKEMERIRGYQLLAMLLKRKRFLLNSHVLHLAFSLVGTLDSGRETSLIPSPTAFQDLLCDLEVWLHAPYELHLSLLEHFVELLTESSEASLNTRLMLELNLVSRLLCVLPEPGLGRPTAVAVGSVLSLLLQGFPKQGDLLRFGQFLAATLPAGPASEKLIELQQEAVYCQGTEGDSSSAVNTWTVWLRNHLLGILMKLLQAPREKSALSQQACEELSKVLGLDWLLLFLQGHLHPSTVTLALRILLVTLSHPTILQRFRDGSFGGGWLDHTVPVHTNRIGSVLGINVGWSGSRGQMCEINREATHLPGFAVLQAFLPRHTSIPEIYFLLISLLLQRPLPCQTEKPQFGLDSIWTYAFGIPASVADHSVTLSVSSMCAEAALLLLAMLRSMLNEPWQSEEEGSWLREYPVTLLQFFRSLYHNVPDIAPLWSHPDFLPALAATLYPLHSRPVSEMHADLVEAELNSPHDEYRSLGSSECLGMNRSQSECMSVAGKAYLACHPARKIILDFARVIVVDNMCQTLASKQTLALDILLEASPERSTKSQQKEFQTDLLMSVINHLLAADVLLGEEAAVPIASGGSHSTLVSNTLYAVQRMVDKLWHGMFSRDSKVVVDFILQLVSQCKRRSPGLAADILHQCLNRTVLYQLSRPHRTVAQQVQVLDSLRGITTQRSLLMGPHSADHDFLACLVYCLVQLYTGSHLDGFGLETEARMTTWHIPTADLDPAGTHNVDFSEGRQLLVKAVRRVWAELMVGRRQVVEECFRVTLPASETGGVDILAARSILEEPAGKFWQSHLTHEKKLISRGEVAITSAAQSRLYRVSSGFALSMLTGGRKHRKEVGYTRACVPTMQDATGWMFTHIAIVRDLVDFQLRQYGERQQNTLKYVSEEWAVLEGDLSRERSLWGPPVGSHLDKWMLDMTEGPRRMRKKMVRNDLFYVHYPYVPDSDNYSAAVKPTKYRRAVSHDSKEYYKRRSAFAALESVPIEEGTETESTHMDADHGDDTIAHVRGIVKAPLRRSRSVPEPSDDDGTDGTVDLLGEGGSVESEERTDNQTVLRLLEDGEKVCHMYRCARIQGLDTSEGLLLFGKEHFYVIDGFTVTATREICDLEHLTPSNQDPIIPKGSRQGSSQLRRTCSKFAYEDVREVHKRRYLLQPIAIEVFSSDGRNYLLAFPRGLRNKVHQRFLSVVPSLTDSSESVSGQKASTSVEQGTGLLSTLVWEKSVTQRWERGELSNFQYLMHLNTLAGRSYNDLMQYPVFPWILADYDTQELDLSNPKSFRDLSKPMGAQTEERLAQYKKRYRDWDDPTGEIPAYHYGTHYSSAMIVASYLVRMEPFTQTFLRLQGGHFDLADRMFHSVRDTWYSASKHNMADVKELIPEFFYLPDFLLNSNNFDLGCKQNGIHLGHVILPAWAKGDPREFIRLHREALECDFVSSHLHEWIDLIFGYKQQGPAAVDAVNLFHHLFYEGQVDIYNINDPLKKTATIGFINNFGQIPKQLFKKPHPPKRVRSKSSGENPSSSLATSGPNDKLFFHHLHNLKPSLTTIKELRERVGQIVCLDKLVLAVEEHRLLIPPQYNRTFSWGFADLSCRLGYHESDKSYVVFESPHEWGHILCATCPNPRTIITAGNSTAVCVWHIELSTKDRARMILWQALYGHTDAVTCLTASATYRVVVSGSRDHTCIIWDLNKLVFVSQLRGHHAPISALCINDLTGDIVSCAGTYIYLWNINGDPVASVNSFSGRSQHILCCCMSETHEWDAQNVIVTGHSDGVVRMWQTRLVQVPNQPLSDFSKHTSDSAPSEISVLVEHEAADDLSSDSDGADDSCCADTTLNPAQSQAGFRSWIGMNSNEEHGITCGSNTALWTDQMEESDGFVLVTYNGSATASKSDITEHKLMSQAETKEYTKEDCEQAGQSELQAGLSTAAQPICWSNEPMQDVCWERQMVLCAKLTMHTAFERKDNSLPAEVTALAISKDHSRVFVGDSHGRVFCWSVSDSPGRTATEQCVKDDGGEACVACGTRFSLTDRKHHCRNCGQLFCQRCSKYQVEIRRLKLTSPVRVCQACYHSLQAEKVGGAEERTRHNS